MIFVIAIEFRVDECRECLLGRSPHANDADFRWGEAPRFPDFENRLAWAAPHGRLTPDECVGVVSRTHRLLLERYGFDTRDIEPWQPCDSCGYPTTTLDAACCCPECANTRVID